MRRFYSWALLIGLVPLSFGFAQTPALTTRIQDLRPEALPYVLQPVRPLTSERHHAADLDFDGIDEWILSQNDAEKGRYCLVESSQPKTCIKQVFFHGVIHVSTVYADLNHDRFKEFFVDEVRGDSLFLHVLGRSGIWVGNLLLEVRAQSAWPWAPSAAVNGLMDVDGDGALDIIVTVQVGAAYQPRGIYAVSWKKQRVLWKHAMGCVPQDVHLVDLDGDGRREIVLGSASPNNREDNPQAPAQINGTDDGHVYVIALDSLGNQRSLLTAGGAYAELRLQFHDADHDGRLEAYVLFTSHRNPPEKVFVGRWDWTRNTIIPSLELEERLVQDFFFMDFNRDGFDELVMASEEGSLKVYDRRFVLVNEMTLGDFLGETLWSEDLNQDGTPEIILTGKGPEGRLTLGLDTELRPLFCLPGYSARRPVMGQGFGKPRLLLLVPDTSNRLKLLAAMTRQSVFHAHARVIWGVGLGLLGITLISALILWWRHQLHAKAEGVFVQALAQATTDPTLIVNSEGRVLRVSGAMAQVLQSLPRDIEGRQISELTWTDETLALRKGIQVILEGNRVQEDLEHPAISIHGNEARLVIQNVQAPSNGQLLWVRLVDESALVESSQTLAWGVMAQRLAHEIKTPLSTVMLSTQRLDLALNEDPLDRAVVSKYLSRIQDQVRRLQKMTDAFLKFSRIERPQIGEVDINQRIEAWFSENGFKVGGDIRVEKTFDPGLPPVLADPQQTDIILQNIFENSLNALRGKGHLNVATRLVQSLPAHSTEPGRPEVEIEIGDSGRGMTAQEMGQLFKPFFSKGEGGTGLGLVIVKKILDDHGGSIRFESESGVGTTAFIRLPAKRS